MTEIVGIRRVSLSKRYCIAISCPLHVQSTRSGRPTFTLSRQMPFSCTGTLCGTLKRLMIFEATSLLARMYFSLSGHYNIPSVLIAI